MQGSAMVFLLQLDCIMDDDEARHESDALTDYISKRIYAGVEPDRVIQSMMEVVVAYLEDTGRAKSVTMH